MAKKRATRKKVKKVLVCSECGAKIDHAHYESRCQHYEGGTFDFRTMNYEPESEANKYGEETMTCPECKAGIVPDELEEVK